MATLINVTVGGITVIDASTNIIASGISGSSGVFSGVLKSTGLNVTSGNITNSGSGYVSGIDANCPLVLYQTNATSGYFCGVALNRTNASGFAAPLFFLVYDTANAVRGGIDCGPIISNGLIKATAGISGTSGIFTSTLTSAGVNSSAGISGTTGTFSSYISHGADMMFSVSNVASTVIATSGSVVPFATTTAPGFSISGYSTSGYFVSPVAGKYLFTYCLGIPAAAVSGYVALRLGGFAGTACLTNYFLGSASAPTTVKGSIIVACSGSQIATLVMVPSASTTLPNTAGINTFTGTLLST